MLRKVAYCSGGLYAVQGGYMDVQWGHMLFRGVLCCSGALFGCSLGLYAVQEGYMDVQWGYMLFRGVICCSGGLYDEENNDDFSGH